MPIENRLTDNGRTLVIKKENPRKTIKVLSYIRAVLQIPFDLSKFNIDLRNRTRVTAGIGEEFLDVEVLVRDNGGKLISEPIFLPKKSSKSIEVDANPLVLETSNIQPLIIGVEYLPLKIKADIDISVDEDKGAVPTRPSRIISTIIFLLAYGATVKLIVEYIEWIKKYLGLYKT